MSTSPTDASGTRRRGSRAPWIDWMVLPALGMLGLVVGYPVVYTLVLSGQEYNLVSLRTGEFTATANYEQLLADPIFWQSLSNTAIYTFGTVAAACLLGVGLALLTENLLGRRFKVVRALLLTPWAVPFVVVAFLFRYAFVENGGIVNEMLLSLGIVSEAVPWLTAATWALPSVMIANIWTQAPFFFLIFSAALAAIPPEVVESARVDRTGPWIMAFKIKLPFLRNAALVSSLLMVIANFNDFAKIWAMTQGGPGYSTTTLVVFVYRLAFQDFELGYASAVGVVWLVLLLIFSLAYVRALRQEPR